MTDRTRIPVRNPRTGQVDGELTPANAAEVAAAATRLRAAQPAASAVAESAAAIVARLVMVMASIPP